jgi:hypothetical protein
MLKNIFECGWIDGSIKENLRMSKAGEIPCAFIDMSNRHISCTNAYYCGVWESKSKGGA